MIDHDLEIEMRAHPENFETHHPECDCEICRQQEAEQ
jgi:hypothetical protein